MFARREDDAVTWFGLLGLRILGGGLPCHRQQEERRSRGQNVPPTYFNLSRSELKFCHKLAADVWRRKKWKRL
jgi:hypothetical protein